MICGILHEAGPPYPNDHDGCLLPIDHDGPHEFICDNGRRWNWETDLTCECDHCMEAMGDYCTIYWEIRSMSKEFLGQLIYDKAGDDGHLEVERVYLADEGIPVNSQEYCDWLTKYKLRQFRVTKNLVYIGRQR